MKYYRVLLPILFSLVPACIWANLAIEIETKAIDTALGYTTDEIIVFSLVLNASFGNNGSSQFGDGSASWIEETTSEDQLYLAVSSASFSGEYARPDLSPSDPYSKLETWWGNDFSRAIEMRIAADQSDIGLRTPAEDPVTTILIRLTDVADFPAIDSYTSPGDYLAPLLGTYTGMSGTLEVRSNSTSAYLRVTSLTISESGTTSFDLDGWTWNAFYPWVYSPEHGWLLFLPTEKGLWVQKVSTGQWILKD